MIERIAHVVAVLVALAGVCPGCSDDADKAPRTALVVEVHTDLQVGEEIDEIRVVANATNGDAEPSDAGHQTASASLSEDSGLLPVNVVLEPAAGVTGVRVIAEGYLDGDRVRVQVRRTEFVADEVRVLHMDLSRACAMECGDENQTCIARGDVASCESDYLDPRYLLMLGEPYDAGMGAESDGSIDAGLDAGDVDAGACTADIETCNGDDDDCDRRVDEGSTICPQDEPFAVIACDEQNGTTACRVIACAPGRLDCDDSPDCETRITAEHCGDCDTTCDLGDVCAQTDSTTGYECLDRNQCPGTTEVCGTSCVDKQIDPENCGDCDEACSAVPNASPACEGGTCALACAEGYRSCNSDDPDADGCETNILTDPDHCGGCEGANTVCPDRPNAETFCDDGICGFRCLDGFLNCNTSMTDGCEVAIGEDHCYSCNNSCDGLLESCCASQRDCCVL